VYITTFFSKTGAFMQWARAGNGRYVKHLGMSVNFLFYFFYLFGWDELCSEEHAHMRTKKKGGGVEGGGNGSFFTNTACWRKKDSSFTNLRFMLDVQER
jgi:hypothetical protein